MATCRDCGKNLWRRPSMIVDDLAKQKDYVVCKACYIANWQAKDTGSVNVGGFTLSEKKPCAC